MKWFLPSFHGDFRFEDATAGACKLVVEKPTPAEIEAIKRWGKRALKSRWISKSRLAAFLADMTAALPIDAPLAEAAAPMAKLLNVRRSGILTALAFESGKVKSTEIVDESGLPRWMKKLQATAEAAGDAARAAVTVRQPKLSCPECSGKPEGERKACDVLWEFLDAEQRKEWLAKRRFTVFGNLTGHAYDVAPRDTAAAAQRGRICFDLDDRVVLHNFDLMLPPEEEALQAKLMLEHRENWIRVAGEVDPILNAAPGTVFENPFFSFGSYS